MAKKNIGSEVGKGLIGVCTYAVFLAGLTATVVISGYGVKRTEVYQAKGVSWEPFDNAAVSSIIRTTEANLRNDYNAMNRWGIKQFGSLHDYVANTSAVMKKVADLGKEAAGLIRTAKRQPVQPANVPLRRAKNPLTSIKV